MEETKQESKQIYEDGIALLTAIHEKYASSVVYKKMVSNMKSVLDELQQLRIKELIGELNPPDSENNII